MRPSGPRSDRWCVTVSLDYRELPKFSFIIHVLIRLQKTLAGRQVISGLQTKTTEILAKPILMCTNGRQNLEDEKSQIAILGSDPLCPGPHCQLG